MDLLLSLAALMVDDPFKLLIVDSLTANFRQVLVSCRCMIPACMYLTLQTISRLHLLLQATVVMGFQQCPFALILY